ncbi:hypothetical protein AAY473_009299 [Plecturocebus cupreus]
MPVSVRGRQALLCQVSLAAAETGFHHVGQAGLELLTANDLAASASQSAGITWKALLVLYYIKLYFTSHIEMMESRSYCPGWMQWRDLNSLQPPPLGFKILLKRLTDVFVDHFV